MTTKKVLTSQKLLPCLIVENDGVVIQKTSGEFVFHSQTKFISREDILKSAAPLYNGEEKETFLKRFEFDEAPFILALEKKEKAAKEKIKAAKEAEEKRIQDLKNEIATIDNPRDLADYFNLKIVENKNKFN